MAKSFMYRNAVKKEYIQLTPIKTFKVAHMNIFLTEMMIVIDVSFLFWFCFRVGEDRNYPRHMLSFQPLQNPLRAKCTRTWKGEVETVQKIFLKNLFSSHFLMMREAMYMHTYVHMYILKK
jgi:hypothetical protein